MAVSAASALRWMPYARALAYVRALLAASRQDLRHGAHQLSRTLSGAFFDLDAPEESLVAARGAQLPEGGLYVCVDLPPLAPALRDVQRAIVRVSVNDADRGSCDRYFDAIRDVLRLLVPDDAGDGLSFVRGSVVYGRDKFESSFALEWVE